MNSKTCTVIGCERDAKTRGWCPTHYNRWRRTGDVQAEKPINTPNPGQPCSINACSMPAKVRGWCDKHYSRWKVHGNPLIVTREYGAGYISAHGYRVINKIGHPNAFKDGKMFEHTYVMSQYLGRPLTKDENVHHINGVKTDNRIENLELWSSSQPKGQRIEDKVAWAKEILNQYEPESLSSEFSRLVSGFEW